MRLVYHICRPIARYSLQYFPFYDTINAYVYCIVTKTTKPIPKGRKTMIEFKFDTQLLINGEGLDEDEIYDYFVENFKGDSLLAVGDDDLIKIHYHTNEPWKVLEYCASLGEISDIVVENMERQAQGLGG